MGILVPSQLLPISIDIVNSFCFSQVLGRWTYFEISALYSMIYLDETSNIAV